MKKIGCWSCILFFALAGLGIWVGVVKGQKWEKEFAAIQIGDTREMVIKKLGEPDVIETQDKPFFGYAYKPCTAPCVERIWYEPYIFILHGLSGWSVSFDSKGHVINKYHYVLP